MKTRVITAVVALIVFVPLLIIGGIPLLLLTLAMGIFCLLYTSDAADEEDSGDLGGRRIIKKKKNEEIA